MVSMADFVTSAVAHSLEKLRLEMRTSFDREWLMSGYNIDKKLTSRCLQMPSRAESMIKIGKPLPGYQRLHPKTALGADAWNL